MEVPPLQNTLYFSIIVIIIIIIGLVSSHVSMKKSIHISKYCLHNGLGLFLHAEQMYLGFLCKATLQLPFYTIAYKPHHIV